MSDRTSYVIGALSALLLTAAPPVMAEDIGGLQVEQSEEYGPYLVTDEGRSVYLFTADSEGTSNCQEQCADAWPPVTTGGQSIEAGDSVEEDLIDTIEREDGSEQVTYGGYPLYLFVRDADAGMTTGQDVHGFGGEWYLVSPDGTAVGGEADPSVPTRGETGADADEPTRGDGNMDEEMDGMDSGSGGVDAGDDEPPRGDIGADADEPTGEGREDEPAGEGGY